MLQPTIKDIQAISGNGRTNTIAVASTGTIYTVSQKIGYAEFFGLWIKPSSASGTPDLKVELEMSHTTPTTEGSSDANWVEPTSFSDLFASLNNETANIISISPVPMMYMRLKVTGINANPADATFTAKLFLQTHV